MKERRSRNRVGISPAFRAQLLRVRVPEVEKLEKLLGVELPDMEEGSTPRAGL